MYTFKSHLEQELSDIREAGLYKTERIITSPQKADITVNNSQEVLNFCANNYLGLQTIHVLSKRRKQHWTKEDTGCLR